jgi:tetratricopeptide (TPR) repeat protein
MAEARNNFGLALAEQARFQEARVCFEEALQLRPDYPDAHHNRGCSCRELGDLPEAEASFRQVLRLRPDLAPAHYNLGLALAEQGRLTEAVDEYHTALDLGPDLADAHNNLGSILLQLDRFPEAEMHFREAFHLRPEFAAACHNLGLSLSEQGRHAESLTAYQEALHLRPQFPEALNRQGQALHALGRDEEAVESYQQALRLRPGLTEVQANLAMAYGDLRRFAEAEAVLRPALAVGRHNAQLHYALGYALWIQGKQEEAAVCCEQAIRLKPDYADPHYVLAQDRLREGNFAEGWPEYEWRLRIKGFPTYHGPAPRWDGDPLEGKTILLLAEQGLGDTLQFIRYALQVQQRGGRVVVSSFTTLLPLLRTCPGIDHLLEAGEPLPAVDVHAYLLSLPWLLGSTVETIPARIPYLSADPGLVRYWREQLRAVDAFKVGVVWKGRPTHQQDCLRSVALREFAPLARLEGVRLVSLQVGPGQEDLAAQENLDVIDLGSRFDRDSFADAAATVMNMDLVITVDTALAHLAGALGVPGWVALSYHADWRWLRTREDSPWYPSMRLFRQPQPGDWPAVFGRITGELALRLAKGGRQPPVGG